MNKECQNNSNKSSSRCTILRNVCEIFAAFFLYGLIYIRGMQYFLKSNFGNEFHKQISSSMARFDIKLVFIKAITFPIAIMLLILIIYSIIFVYHHKYMNIQPLVLDISNHIISSVMSAFGIISIILSVLGISNSPSHYTNLLSPIVIIVAGFLIGFTVKVIIHEQFLDKDHKYRS